MGAGKPALETTGATCRDVMAPRRQVLFVFPPFPHHPSTYAKPTACQQSPPISYLSIRPVQVCPTMRIVLRSTANVSCHLVPQLVCATSRPTCRPILLHHTPPALSRAQQQPPTTAERLPPWIGHVTCDDGNQTGTLHATSRPRSRLTTFYNGTTCQ